MAKEVVPSAPTRDGERRFHAFNVGLPKTGTVSVAGIFNSFRSAHEYMMPQTCTALVEHAKGELSKEGLRYFLLYRDQRGMLEMDSAHFHHSYIDILAEVFPESKFIFTVRDCYSWLDSAINHQYAYISHNHKWMREYHHFIVSGHRLNDVTGETPGTPKWARDYAHALQFTPNSPNLPKYRKEVVRHLSEGIDEGLEYWANINQKILQTLPKDRSIIVKTNEISQSIKRMADLVGVEESELHAEKDHLNKANLKLNLLDELDQNFLRDRCEYHCGDLMLRLFPELPLDELIPAVDVPA